MAPERRVKFRRLPIRHVIPPSGDPPPLRSTYSVADAVRRVQPARPRGDRTSRRVGLRRSGRAGTVAGHGRRRRGVDRRDAGETVAAADPQRVPARAAGDEDRRAGRGPGDSWRRTSNASSARGEARTSACSASAAAGRNVPDGFDRGRTRTQLLDFAPRRRAIRGRGRRRHRDGAAQPAGVQFHQHDRRGGRDRAAGEFARLFARCWTRIICGSRPSRWRTSRPPCRSSRTCTSATWKAARRPARAGRPITARSSALLKRRGYDGLMSVEAKTFDAESGARSLAVFETSVERTLIE